MNQYSIALSVSIVFFIIKYIETHVIKKDPLPLKILLRECMFVFISVIIGFFMIQQVSPIIQTATMPRGGGTSVAFTDNPTF